MSCLLQSGLVLCDLDNLLLNENGEIPQAVRDVLQLFCSRGGKLTVFSQRSPRAVRAVLGGIRLAAPALVCGGTMAYNYSDGSAQALCSFAGHEKTLFQRLPLERGVGVALQMRDGTTRVLRMSAALDRHLKREWTPYLLVNAADINSQDVLRIMLYQDDRSVQLAALLDKTLGESAGVLLGERFGADAFVLSPGRVGAGEMLAAVCSAAGAEPEDTLVLAGGQSMLELMRAAGHSAVAADAPAELRLAAQRTALTDAAQGAVMEILYQMVQKSEKLA